MTNWERRLPGGEARMTTLTTNNQQAEKTDGKPF
jgi:hypothetical protein